MSFIGREMACDAYCRTSPIFDEPGRLGAIREIARNNGEHARSQAGEDDTEQMLCGILRAVPFGVGVTRDGKMIWENDQMVRLTGYSHEETRGLSYRILFQGDSEFQSARQALLLGIAGTGTASVETSLVRKDGSLINAVVSATRVHHLDPSSDIIFTVTDISERKQMEQALRKNEKKYRELVENANSIILWMDRTGVVTFFNEYASRFFGFSPEEIIGRNVVGTIVPATESGGRDLLQMTLDLEIHPERYASNENENICKDGTRVWVLWTNKPIFDDQGQCIGILSIGNDITERKRAEEELQFRNVLLSAQQEASVDGILVVDEQTRILSYNRRFVEMWGIPAKLIEDRVDEPVLQYVTAQMADPQSFQLRVQYLYEHRQETSQDELLLADGRVFDRYSAPMFGPDGRYYGRIWYFRDVTTRKRAAEEKEKLEAQLRQAQKMEAVGQLAGGVAHDFNNFLQVILGYLDVLQDGLSEDTVYREAFNSISEAATRAADLTRQLLAFGRRQVIQPANLDLNDLVGGVLKLINRVIGEHIDLRFVPGKGPATVRVDKGQIEQVLVNLCVNARDAMPTGGTLAIATENVFIGDEYCRDHPSAQPGPYVLCALTDTGQGMDEKTLAHIFEPFFTTKEVGQGTGLGLAMVEGIVKQHGGFIHVYSEPGRGTEFKLYFPASERSADSVAAKREEAPVGGTETILMAEDNEMVRNSVSRMLQNAGYTILTACDGEEAIQVFEENGEHIELALLDVMMLGLNGREVMDYIHARCPRIRFLFSSGYSETGIHTDFVIKEELRLITKPYTNAQLLRAVREALDAGQGVVHATSCADKC
ncbi:MAG: PAS domain S-box protein [Candidatus Hydrogenedentes bacterium]|nr:PAS domain S-box protein [Candidatus Hydrogenedentota bacterium]